jgi:hypothetical protein
MPPPLTTATLFRPLAEEATADQREIGASLNDHVPPEFVEV